MGKRFALLIGVGEYESEFESLVAASRDVEAMRRVLLKSEVGGFAESNVTVLNHPEPQQMREAIATLFMNRQKDDLLLLYFSGHGCVDDGGIFHLTCRTTRKDLLSATAIPSEFVHQLMQQSRSKQQVVILDSCFSGAFAKGMPAKGEAVNLGEQLGGQGRAILTSSSAVEYSFEQKEADLSVYTRYLLEGLETGAADEDRNGKITVDELHRYTQERIRETAPAMSPKIYAIEEGYRIELARAPIGDPRVIYRKRVEEIIARESEGEISPIDLSYLNELRHNSRLSSTEAEEIEAEVLSPYRQRREKLQRYEQVLREAIQRRYPLTESDKQGLNRLQQALRLRDEDVIQIERRVPRPRRLPLTRRQFLVFSFGGAGLGIVAAWQPLQEIGRFFQSLPSPSSSTSTSQPGALKEIPLSTSQPITPKEIFLRNSTFEVVTVNAQGKQINRQSKRAQLFAEDLGNKIMLEMVAIPGGEFVMGSPDNEAKREINEGPQHFVKVQPFFMGQFEVTQAQWSAVAKLPKVKIDLDDNPSRFKGAKRPVENISWSEAVEFCDRLSQKTGRTYRLPSEAEWEYACRAGTKTPFHFGETITTDLVNFAGNSTYASAPKGQYRRQPIEVGSFSANAFGLYDMHGNVWEWCSDHWYNSYSGGHNSYSAREMPTDGSPWLSLNDNASRLLRGGSWVVEPWICRSTSRIRSAPEIHVDDVGFRCVCDRSRTL